ncbi:MAG TPA: helicase HerA-like domain-containing protein [Candidatus Limnocylindria bacterium]|nr:helicase HerA-like domain-containing protein [Candidatus Limnocylindria bacterium]
MTDYEKLGQFYLGREYDLEAKKSTDRPALYDSKDLVTHAAVVGMTGSGKTGLCIDLLEEAVIDGVPAIVIDPKGDLTNLLLAFPELRPEDFRPWINEEDAARKGVTPDEHAKQQADLWRNGLAAWDQSGERIRTFRESADFAIYTPGSTAGIPVSIVRSFSAPPPALREDSELFRERIATTATSLLTLVGIDADPIKSREHILLSTLLATAWGEGRDLDLAALVGQVQRPPVKRIGALELDTFYPAKDREELALRINGLLASPGFAGWLDGEPLDIGAMFRTAHGKPRVSIFSIAHLGDAERMFFVALLLNEILGWVRTQSGTTSLRAILYMDEIFGFFPPVAEPPSKRPLLTLLKQARAYGLGVVLATQNPVDLDYKGLANIGTWLIGRLQTDRDKMRVLDGLEGASAAASATFDRKGMEELLAGLGTRVFLMNNVHEDGPVVIESRWAMSYLRGPLTRDQIKLLMRDRRPAAVPVAAASARDSRADEDQHAREERDAAVEALRAKYSAKIRRAEEKARRATQVVEREEGQVKAAGMQTAVSAGATILTAILGRKTTSYSTIGRGTTAARGAARTMREREDVKRAKENLAVAQQELADLQAELEEKVAELAAGAGR